MIETLTRAELLEQIIQTKKGVNRHDAEPVIDRFFNLVSQTLGRGEVVRMSGFGNFLLLDKKERPGRNPKTGEVIPVTARRVVTFRPGNKLKDLIDGFTKISLNHDAASALKQSQKDRQLEEVE